MKTLLPGNLDLEFENVLARVDAPADALAAHFNGMSAPVQRAPATVFDEPRAPDADGTVALALFPRLGALEGCAPPFSACECASPAPITVETLADGSIAIRNGAYGAHLPPDGAYDPPFDAPILPFAADGSWESFGFFTGVMPRGAINTVIESLGPCFVQWRTTYRWGNGGRLDIVARWAAGSDTMLVSEEISEDADAAFELHPFGGAKADAWTWGGGENNGPMRRAAFSPNPDARESACVPRRIGSISHIAYFNQWNLAWAGFTAGGEASAPFLGIFSAFGGSWRKRGFMRPALMESRPGGVDCFLRFPVRAGRRVYGLVCSTRGEALVDRDDKRCLLNRRKVQLSDFRFDKVSRWVLDPALEPRTARLVDPGAFAARRESLIADPGIRAAAEAMLADLSRDGVPHDSRRTAAAWLLGREDALADCAARLRDSLASMTRQTVEGGYEGTVIFHGRQFKAAAYDLDLLWTLGLLDEGDYRSVRSALLLLAYIYADSDHANYGDFWPYRESGEGIPTALRDEMGDTPVPPNFASEFFTTTGMMAELFPAHPAAPAWRKFAGETTLAFLETQFEPDGTYHESINYHSHAISEFSCYFGALLRNGGRDFFLHPVVSGSYRHFAQLLTPSLVDGIQPFSAPREPGEQWAPAYASPDRDGKGRAAFPADGNSGGFGLQQETRDDLPIAAAAYASSDPVLAAALIHAWKASGRPIFMAEHPIATLAAIDPVAPAAPLPWKSVWRHGLGIVSKSVTDDGDRRYVLFRAGRATHHMDFDQGNVQIFAYGHSLLCDHGYHTRDTDGGALPAAATFLHNTLTYAERRELSSGYAGLELAPEPESVVLGEDADEVVLRIVNTNFRDLGRLPYNQLLHAPTTVHVRRYRFDKRSGAVTLRDTLEQGDPGHAVAWFHTRSQAIEVAPGEFRCGPADGVNLVIRFAGAAPEVIENRRQGPLFSLGVRLPTSGELVTELIPRHRF